MDHRGKQNGQKHRHRHRMASNKVINVTVFAKYPKTMIFFIFAAVVKTEVSVSFNGAVTITVCVLPLQFVLWNQCFLCVLTNVSRLCCYTHCSECVGPALFSLCVSLYLHFFCSYSHIIQFAFILFVASRVISVCTVVIKWKYRCALQLQHNKTEQCWWLVLEENQCSALTENKK